MGMSMEAVCVVSHADLVTAALEWFLEAAENFGDGLRASIILTLSSC